jgi:hypothetical protein
MVVRYIQTVEEYLQKAVASHLREERSPIFLLGNTASTHYPTGFIPGSLMFGATPDEK